MRQRLLLPLLLSLFLVACSKDDDGTPIARGDIDLSNPKVGQFSTFLRYTTSCDDPTGAFEYTGDTLVVRVIREGGKIFFEESLTPHSPTRLAGNGLDPVKYPFTKIGDNALIPVRGSSNLFFFYANDTLRLKTPPGVVLKQDACMLVENNDPFIGNDIGQVANFDIGPLKMRDKLAASCEPYFSLDAYLIYDEHQLYMSHVLNFGVNGWVLLPQ